jgi:hypothetical protein
MFGGTNFMERELAGLRPDVTQAMASSYTGMSPTTGIAIVRAAMALTVWQKFCGYRQFCRSSGLDRS